MPLHPLRLWRTLSGRRLLAGRLGGRRRRLLEATFGGSRIRLGPGVLRDLRRRRRAVRLIGLWQLGLGRLRQGLVLALVGFAGMGRLARRGGGLARLRLARLAATAATAAALAAATALAFLGRGSGRGAGFGSLALF